MKLNRKGFTLVELLTTIVILSLVLLVSAYGMIKVREFAERKIKTISLSGIKSSANIYSGEVQESEWQKQKEEFEYFCVTVGELMNKGFIKKDSILPNGYDKETFIFVKRNLLTKNIIGEYLPSEYNDKYNICSKNFLANGEIITKNPKIKGNSSYTDKLVVEFENGKIFLEEDKTKNNISGYDCFYGNSYNAAVKAAGDYFDGINSNDSKRRGKIDGNKCIIKGDSTKPYLHNNTDYYVLVYMNGFNGSHIVAEGNNKFKTSDFNETTINGSNNIIKIQYNHFDTNNNVINPSYKYFKSSKDATINESVLECDSNFNCNVKTNRIMKNRWYKVNKTSINNIELTPSY